MDDIYNNPELYNAIHKNIDTDKKMITHYAKKCNGKTLELAAGTGRLARYIIDLGLPYTGIDISKVFIKEAKNTFQDKANFQFGNMQNFNHSISYDFIFIGFNSFLHNLTDQEAKSCLNSVYQHLVRGGIFFISAYIPDPEFLYQGNELYPFTDYFNYKNKRCRIMGENNYDEFTQINNITWYVEYDGIISKEKYNYNMRMYYPHMMDLLINESGLIIEEKYGNWDNSPLDDYSPMQIYICKKAD